jgi:hypothetical protein
MRGLTKRAPDAGDSAAISSSFLHRNLFLAGRLRRPCPSAGNANRWLASCKIKYTEKIIMENSFGDWLNRTGIILNFLAGFLLAPEIIGIERLQKLETEIETKINNLETRFRPIRDYKKISKNDDPEGYWILTLGGGIIFIPTIFIIALVALPIVIGFTCFFIYGLLSAAHSQSIIKLVFYCLGDLVLLFIVVLLGFIFLMFGGRSSGKFSKKIIEGMKQVHTMGFGFLLMEILPPFYSLINFFVRILNKEKIFQSLLVWIGIIFFVTGNLLQLIATF